MQPRLLLGATYVNFTVSGTAILGVDYKALVPPGYSDNPVMAQSWWTYPDPRGPSNRQAYSVVLTLESGLGYALGEARSAQMWIKP